MGIVGVNKTTTSGAKVDEITSNLGDNKVDIDSINVDIENSSDLGEMSFEEFNVKSTISNNEVNHDEQVLAYIEDEIDRIKNEMDRIGKDDPRYPALEAERDALISKKIELEQMNSEDNEYKKLEDRLQELNNTSKTIDDEINVCKDAIDSLNNRRKIADLNGDKEAMAHIDMEIEKIRLEMIELREKKRTIDDEIIQVKEKINNYNINEADSSKSDIQTIKNNIDNDRKLLENLKKQEVEIKSHIDSLPPDSSERHKLQQELFEVNSRIDSVEYSLQENEELLKQYEYEATNNENK